MRKQWKPWVENRVSKIRNGPVTWNHVSFVVCGGELTVAELLGAESLW